MYKSRSERLLNYGGVRHGLFGYMSPILHPIRWNRACNAHSKICRIHSYLCEQKQTDLDAINIVYSKTWILMNQVCDWLG